MLLVNVAAYVSVRAKLLPDLPVPAVPSATQPVVESPGADWLGQHLPYWWAEQIIQPAGWVGVAGAVALPFVLLLAVMVTLAGRLGGVRPAVSAFFWSLVLVVIVVPWGSLVPACTYSGPLQGIEGYINSWCLPAESSMEGVGPGAASRMQSEVRLVAPVVASLLLALTVLVRFRRSYCDVVSRIEPASGAPV